MPKSESKQHKPNKKSWQHYLEAYMFTRYQKWESISITGNVTCVAQKAFGHLQHLKNLSISHTKLQTFEAEVFHPKNVLEHLQLNNNKFTTIPQHIFNKTPHLSFLDLNFNPIVHQNCTTIGEQFHNLNQLTSLGLGNMTVNYECWTSIPSDFFQPLHKTLMSLHITKTNVFEGDITIFKHFQMLKVLDISMAMSFKNCPGAAEELFWNLPQSIELLVMQCWAAILLFEWWNCTLTTTKIAGLKSLKRLKHLDMKYGDLIFGHELDRNLFSGFKMLEHLDIGWCRFSKVVDFAFSECRKLTALSLDGNPLGNRRFILFFFDGPCQLTTLNLAYAGLKSEFNMDLRLDFTLRGSVRNLDLAGNLIRHMPRFTGHTVTDISTLTSIVLDNNFIEDFIYNTGGKFSDHCGLILKLTYLIMQNNDLIDLRYLCKSLTHLNLSNNRRLKERWLKNQAELSNSATCKFLSLKGIM